MWDLPGPGLKPVSPALAGGFLTTAPPGKYFQLCFGHELFQAVWPQAHHLTSLSLVLLIVRSTHVAGQGWGGQVVGCRGIRALPVSPWLFPGSRTSMTSYSSISGSPPGVWGSPEGAGRWYAPEQPPANGRQMSVDTCLVALPSETTTRGHVLYQELTNNISLAKSGPSPAITNTALLENSDTHLFTCGTYCLWLLWYFKG